MLPVGGVTPRNSNGPARPVRRDAIADLDNLIQEIGPEIAPFDAAQCDVAFQAFERYGKGMGTAAKLNLGDCASYALAKSLDLSLLFKGEDFRATDIVPAV